MKPEPMTRRSSLAAFVSRHRLSAYIFITFLWSWAWWIPATLAFKGALSLSFSWLPLLMIGAPGPSISAIALTGALDGMEGLKSLLRKFLIWPLLSSVILGAIWMLWHTPLFWLPGGAAISGAAVTVSAVLWYLAYLIGWSILFTWMYNNTHGSVLLAVLLHGSLNAGSGCRG